MKKFLLSLPLALSLAASASATEVQFSAPIKSGPLLGVVATGTIDLEDGIYTGQGTEVFTPPGGPNPNTGDIVGFEVSISTLTFTGQDNLLGPNDFRLVFNKGIVTQFLFSGAVFNPGASLFISLGANPVVFDVRTTGGQGQQLQSIGGPIEFTVVP